MDDRIADDRPALSRTPLRKVNTRGSQTITGYIFSRKMPNHVVDGSSTNELQFIKRAELDPRIAECLAQPILLRIRTADGGMADAYPDFAALVDGRWELHEVKPDAEYARPDIADRLRRTADAAERAGYPYSVALASELWRKSDRDSILAAWRRMPRKVHPITLAAVDAALADGPRTISELLAVTAAHRTTIDDCHAMLASGHVRANMAKRADASMLLHSRHSAAWFTRLIPFRDPRGDVV